MTVYKAIIGREQSRNINTDILTDKIDENNTYKKLANIIGINEQDIIGLLSSDIPGVVFFEVTEGTKLELSDVIRINEQKIEELLGKVSPFLDNIFENMKTDGIDVSSYELDHICYKVETDERYQELKEALHELGELLSEAQISGRSISTFKLREPILYNDRKIPCLELPAPKKGSIQKEGFDHVEFAIHGDLKEFMKKYENINFDTKGMQKTINPDASKKYDGCEVKFHQNTLEYVIKYEQA